MAAATKISFRDSFVSFIQAKGDLSTADIARVNKLARVWGREHRFLWTRAGEICQRRYERETGNKLKSFDDRPFLDWLLKNAPTILKFLLLIFAL